MREAVEQAKAAIDAIYRDRALTPGAKLDALEEISRHAEKQDARLRAAIRRRVKAGRNCCGQHNIVLEQDKGA